MESIRLATVVLLLLLNLVEGITDEISYCGQLGPNVIPLMRNSQSTHHWPWHTAIYHLNKKSVSSYQCGGTLISSNTILTAAHCVSVYNLVMKTKRVLISLGRLNLDVNESSAQNFEVAEIILHPNYTSIDYRNDIAIVRLAADATFNNYVRPICLWNSNKTELSTIEGRGGTVVGWGETETGEASKILQQAVLPVVPFFSCVHSAFAGRYISQKNFCAGLQNGTGICFGDSGGSMTFEENGVYSIRGIVSITPAKLNQTARRLMCDTMQYAIFTDVAQHLKWIEEVTSECKIRRDCDEIYSTGRYIECDINLYANKIKGNCKFIFNLHRNVTFLSVVGLLFSDLSGANKEFESLKVLEVKPQLKTVEKAQLTVFRRIEILRLRYNEISELDAHAFDDLKSLTELSLVDNMLKELHPNIFSELRELTKLYLSSNRIEILPPDLFRNNEKLETIFLQRNNLKELHADLFVNLPRLITVLLGNNPIEVLPANIFRNNGNLEKIDLIYNQLKGMNYYELIEKLPKLRSLRLDGNQIEELHPDLFRNNGKLEEISLGANKITGIHPDFLAELKHLTVIYFIDNQIEILPTNLFRNNEKLIEIHMEYCKIKEIHPDLVAPLQNLKIISLNSNHIEVLPANLFRNNEELEEIWMSDNKIKELHPNSFATLENLIEIYLNENQIENLPAHIFRNNGKLEKIRISSNKIKEIHSDLFASLRNLTTIFLGRNQIEILPANLFRNNENLKGIHMASNQLKYLDSDLFLGLHNLEEIDFNFNQIEVLPAGLFRDNAKLSIISLANNRITVIESDFHNLLDLGSIDLSSNICINDLCGRTFCDTISVAEMGENFRRKCSVT